MNRLFYRFPAARLLTTSLLLLGGLTVFSADAQTGSRGMSRAEFLESLTSVEQKIPIQLVIQRRLERGEPVPQIFSQRLSRFRPEVGDAGQVYQITGASADAVADQIRSLGVEPIYISSNRPYATAFLSLEQLFSVVSSSVVVEAHPISVPQPQGYFEAYEAHVGSDPPEDWTSLGLTGTGVVIGIISTPVVSADLAALDADFGGSIGRVIPESDSLHQWSAAVDDSYGDVTNDNFGSADLLALLQIVYKFAPGAEIVIASPATYPLPPLVIVILVISLVFVSTIALAPLPDPPDKETFVYVPATTVILPVLFEILLNKASASIFNCPSVMSSATNVNSKSVLLPMSLPEIVNTSSAIYPEPFVVIVTLVT